MVEDSFVWHRATMFLSLGFWWGLGEEVELKTKQVQGKTTWWAGTQPLKKIRTNFSSYHLQCDLQEGTECWLSWWTSSWSVLTHKVKIAENRLISLLRTHSSINRDYYITILTHNINFSKAQFSVAQNPLLAICISGPHIFWIINP